MTISLRKPAPKYKVAGSLFKDCLVCMLIVAYVALSSRDPAALINSITYFCMLHITFKSRRLWGGPIPHVCHEGYLQKGSNYERESRVPEKVNLRIHIVTLVCAFCLWKHAQCLGLTLSLVITMGLSLLRLSTAGTVLKLSERYYVFLHCLPSPGG